MAHADDALLEAAGDGTPAVQVCNRIILSAIQQGAHSIQIKGDTVCYDNAVQMTLPTQLVDALLRRLCVMTDTLPPYAFDGVQTGIFEVRTSEQSVTFTCSYDYHGQSFVAAINAAPS